MQVSRNLGAAANRIPAAAFFSHSPHRGIFDGFTVEGRNAKLDVRAIMPALERANGGGVSVVREGRIKWTFSPKGGPGKSNILRMDRRSSGSGRSLAQFDGKFDGYDNHMRYGPR
ncbi:hypothetical protein FOZ63_011079 [Perkinsus olseni]|uniref:Uncharacterized protein n=1 Tax=Perkinsus olseni TaxID=32597 RepID=A0A7J6QR33_PEROL|nr:hypothetical protein FOZ63_011079 [Perkinsus olseni]